MRAGTGFDVHPLANGRALILGGVAIEFAQGLEGHSDGDVLCHAICDALLGAAGLGDLGAMFPSGDELFRGASSLAMLEAVGERLSGLRYQISNIDSTIVAQNPRLEPYKESMRANIAGALGIESGFVSVKATTTDGLGSIGRGEGIAAFAICLLESHNS